LRGSYLGAAVPGWRVVAATDFNADGHPDLVWQNDQTRQLVVWYMSGPDGNEFLGWNWLSDRGALGLPGWTVVATGDFDLDGHPDVVWQNETTREAIVWYIGEGGNVFLGQNALGDMGAAALAGWTVVGTGDFDNDSHIDLVWQNDVTRAVAVWFMSGAGGNILQGGNWLSETGVAGWKAIVR
jgi:hypothetical protein